MHWEGGELAADQGPCRALGPSPGPGGSVPHVLLSCVADLLLLLSFRDQASGLFGAAWPQPVGRGSTGARTRALLRVKQTCSPLHYGATSWQRHF